MGDGGSWESGKNSEGSHHRSMECLSVALTTGRNKHTSIDVIVSASIKLHIHVDVQHVIPL